jgi:hypothetical protein
MGKISIILFIDIFKNEDEKSLLGNFRNDTNCHQKSYSRDAQSRILQYRCDSLSPFVTSRINSGSISNKESLWYL